MTDFAFFDIPEWNIFQQIVKTFIEFKFGIVPFVSAVYRKKNKKMELIQWDWNFNQSTAIHKNQLSKILKNPQTQFTYIVIFNSYMEFLLNSIGKFLNQNNLISDGEYFKLNINYSQDRRTFGFHKDGSEIILGFTYLNSEKLSQSPQLIQQKDITLIIHKDEVQQRQYIRGISHQKQYRPKTINYKIPFYENQILFFNNQTFLHSSPFNAKSIIVRFSISKIKSLKQK
jgi:hypothetical protein